MPDSLDSTLGPLLRAQTGRPATSAILAVLTRSIELGYQPRTVLNWVSNRATDPAVTALASNPAQTARLVLTARSATVSTASSISTRLAVARRTTAHLFLPTPAPDRSPAQNRKAATVLTYVGGKLLAQSSAGRQWDSWLWHGTTASADLGASRAAVTAWLGLAEGRCVTIRQRRADGSRVVAMRRLSASQGQGIVDFADLVDDLASEVPQSACAGLILSGVDHPAVTFGPIGHEAWLAAVCRLAGLSEHPGVTGRGRRAEAAFKGMPTDSAAGVREWLDTIAADSGASAKAAAAQAARTEAASARKAGLLEARTEAARRRPMVATILKRLPGPGDPVRRKDAWLARATAAAASVPAEDVPAVRARVVRGLESAGYAERVALKVSDNLFGAGGQG